MDRIVELQQQVAEYERLCETQKQYREDSIASLKGEIGLKLHAEFEDFFETKDIPMNEMLGEIYRAKLEKIAKILKGFDIEVQMRK